MSFTAVLVKLSYFTNLQNWRRDERRKPSELNWYWLCWSVAQDWLLKILHIHRINWYYHN